MKKVILATLLCLITASLNAQTPLTACGVLNQATTYVLQNDVSSSGTCFSIQTTGVTLDLNGHTVTYSTCDNGSCLRAMGNITSISRTSNQVTVTIDQPNSNLANTMVQISGVADNSFNGMFVVNSHPSSTTFTYNQSGPNTTSSGGTAAAPAHRYAVLGQQCWDQDVDDNPCGGPFDNTTIMSSVGGAKIVQSPNAMPYSDAIRFGQGGGTGSVVHGLDITVVANSAKAFDATWTSGALQFYGNTVHDNVTQVINRHQLDGVVVYSGADQNGQPNYFHDNTIIGPPQGGFVTWAPGSKIYNNQIYLNGTITNDFCVYAYANGVEVYGNTCDNSQGTNGGRGIHVSGANASIHDNTIKAQEWARNAEYNGCETGGAYGIQLEDPNSNGATTGVNVFNNNVTVYANQCDAAALRVTDTQPTASNLVHDNTFTSVRVGTSTKVAAAFTGAGANGGVTIQHNNFTSDTAFAPYFWDCNNNMQFVNNTISIGSNPSGWLLFNFRNAIPCTQVMQDPVFMNGASDVSAGIPLDGFISWAASEQWYLNWTTTMQILTPSGLPVAGASVVITDALGGAVFSGTTNTNGLVTAVLSEYRRYNDAASGQEQENHTPHTITVTKTNCQTSTANVTADSQKTTTITLACVCS